MKKHFKILPLLVVLFLSTACLFAQITPEGNYFTSFDGTKIYYEVKGSGYPVILIHGFSGTGQGWKNCAVYNDLLNAGYKVILMDLRGNGRSDKPHIDSAYAHDAEVKDIIGLMTFLNVANYDAVGCTKR